MPIDVKYYPYKLPSLPVGPNITVPGWGKTYPSPYIQPTGPTSLTTYDRTQTNQPSMPDGWAGFGASSSAPVKPAEAPRPDFINLPNVDKIQMWTTIAEAESSLKASYVMGQKWAADRSIPVAVRTSLNSVVHYLWLALDAIDRYRRTGQTPLAPTSAISEFSMIMQWTLAEIDRLKAVASANGLKVGVPGEAANEPLYNDLLNSMLPKKPNSSKNWVLLGVLGLSWVILKS